jgi:hypothetical protein
LANGSLSSKDFSVGPKSGGTGTGSTGVGPLVLGLRPWTDWFSSFKRETLVAIAIKQEINVLMQINVPM